MKHSTIGLMVSAAFGIVYASVRYAANKKAREDCRTKAHEELYNDKGSVIKMAKEELEAGDKILKAEEKTFGEMTSDWDKNNHYKGALYRINDEAKKAIRMLEIDPDNVENKRYAEIKEKAKIALDASKKALGLSQAEKERDRLVKAAQDKYAKQAATLNTYSGDAALATTAASLRATAEKERDEAIKKASEAYKAKKARYDAKVAEWDEKILEAKTVREEMLTEGRKHILAEKARKIDDLNAKKTNASESIRQMIVENRTDYEKHVLDYDHYKENLKILADSDKAENSMYLEKYTNLSVTDKLAAYFKGKNLGMGTVFAVGLTPVIGLCFVAWQYIGFLLEIMNKMKGDS